MKYGFAFASSARGPCDFGPLADLAISVFREVSMNTLFPQILEGSHDNSCEELACESRCSRSLSSTRFSLNSCNHSGMLENTGLSELVRDSHFFWFWGFGWFIQQLF